MIKLNLTKTMRSSLNYKKYLLGFVFFFLFLFAFDRGIFFSFCAWEDNYYSKVEFNKIFYRKRDFNRNFLKLPKGTYNTLIMGTSRTFRGIHPYFLEKQLNQKAFKIAGGKKQLKFNYYFYKEYKKYAGVPKVIVYGLDYFIFRMESHPFLVKAVSGEDDTGYNYSNGPLLLLSNKEKIDSFFNNLLDQLNENSKPKALKVKTPNVIDPFVGFGKGIPPDKRKPGPFKRYEYARFPGKEGVYFTKLLEVWEKDGAQVILVFLPDYIGTYESNFQIDIFKKDFQTLTAPYKNIFIYDYNHPDKFPLKNPAYFIDGGYGKTNSHLSKKGARVLNRLLLEDIKKHYQ